MRRLALLVLIATAPATAGAQNTAVELLDRGVKAYKDFAIDAARPLFAQIVSPSFVGRVDPDVKVKAYKYLGASFAVLTLTDSAEKYFMAALDFDPFTDLDPAEFSAAELGPFSTAKQKVFRLGVQPVVQQVVNPRVDSAFAQFPIVTTHRSQVTVSLAGPSERNIRDSIIVFSGFVDGFRNITWDGRVPTRPGAIADSGTYVLRVEATSTVGTNNGQRTSETQVVRIEQSFDALEDTLPELRRETGTLLVDSISKAAPWMDLAKGLFVGTAASALSYLVMKSDNDDAITASKWEPTTHIVVAALVGVGSGAGSWWYRTSRRQIPANTIENARRQNQRLRYNNEIRARNQAKLAATLLIITPLASAR